jgi:flagellar hook protein FlgE
MSFQQGLSGLNASSKSLEIIGNNVANANTVGFKQSQAIFSDVFANSLTGTGASQIGIGTKLARVQQQFTQGNISNSNNPLDVAINGQGFFRMADVSGAVTYSRNGQFQLDKDGFIVNADNKILTGYTADASGVLSTGSPQNLSINTSDLAPRVTENVDALVNLDSRNGTLTAAGFDPTDPTTYHNSSSISVFDSLGNSHTLQSFYVKTAPGTWNVYTTVDGVTPALPATPATTLVFGPTGVSPTGATATVNIPVTTGAATPFPVTLDYGLSTQFGSNFSVNSLSQDGFTSGRLASFNVGGDGTILGRYTNGQSNVLGQVVLANFTNPNGLQSLGNNAWAESSTSGPSLVGPPNTGSLGVLQSAAVEDSNVDLTAELVNMITAQRVYQANAQTIKTQDQVLQTLVNLR